MSNPQRKNVEKFLLAISIFTLLILVGGIVFVQKNRPVNPAPISQAGPATKPATTLESNFDEAQLAAAIPWPSGNPPAVDDKKSDVHRFVFKPSPGQTISENTIISVAGSFNNWSKTAHKLNRQQDGTWQLAMRLPGGVYYYKFVIDGQTWVNDKFFSDTDLEIDDTFGGKNSAVLVGEDFRKFPAPEPGRVYIPALRHNPADPADASAASKDCLRLSMLTLANDLTGVNIVYQGKGESTWHWMPMDRIETSLGKDRYVGQINPKAGPVRYAFELVDGKTNGYFAGNQAVETLALAARAAYLNDVEPAFATPDWAKHAVWYQIFAERFRNGDSSNDPEYVKKWTSDWWATLPGEKPGAENFYKNAGNVWNRWFGGDIQGIQQQLPYLRKLGITAIYLNPMFQADSQHKYDTRDYRHIDDGFGVKDSAKKLTGETDDPGTWQWSESDKVFLAFVAEAHKQGFKVILDGVFNHVGRSHPFFQDVLNKGKESPYADWFDVRDFGPPVKYIAWDRGGDPATDGALPVFKKNDETGLARGPQEHIFDITRRWLAPDGDPSKGVDGFRLDVPGDIPHPFWIAWHAHVRSIKPDAYISGEIWDWAQPWLNKGDQFDAVMNYRFASTVQDFFVNQTKAIRPTEFHQRCQQLMNNYPLQVAQVQMNLFDSHDTDRFASMFVNPDFIYDASNRIQDNNPKYNPAKPNEDQWLRMKQAVAFQMCFVGAPMIYYGDEAGMWGPDDPSNRQPMIWKDLEPYDDPQVSFREDLFNHYQRAIAARNALPALRTGAFHPMKFDDQNGTVAFSRQLGEQIVYVVISRSGLSREIELPMERIPDGSRLVDYMNPDQVRVTNPNEKSDSRPTLEVVPGSGMPVQDGKVRLSLPAYGTMILVNSAR